MSSAYPLYNPSAHSPPPPAGGAGAAYEHNYKAYDAQYASPHYPFRQQQMPGGFSSYDPEAQQCTMYDDEVKIERQIRHGFLKKVYGIVLAQLVATFLFSFALMSNAAAMHWAQTNGLALIMVGGIGALVVLCYLTCKDTASQSYPSNYILLGLFTFFESLCIGLLCTLYEQQVVMEAFLATSFIVLGLTVFAFQTKYDFTSWMGALFFILLGFLAFGLVRMLFPQSQTIEVIYASAGALIFSVYLIIDTQLLVGNGKIRMEEDDYILAAIMIYLDVINLFLYILRIIAALRRND